MKRGVPVSNTLVKDLAHLIVEKYVDGLYEYICYAEPGTATNEKGWRIVQITNDAEGGFVRSRMAEGNASFDHIAENYAEFTYS